MKPTQVGAHRETIQTPQQRRRQLTRWGLAALVGAACSGAVGGGLGWLFEAREITVRVDRRIWTRTLTLEELTEHSGEAWRSELPEGSYSHHCARRFKTTERCDPHDCNPHRVRSGSRTVTRWSTCYRSCDVYADWCGYLVRTWDAIDQAGLGGSGEPTDPLLHLPVWGGRRVRREAAYRVFFRGIEADREWSRDYDLPSYEQFAIGRRYHAVWREDGDFTLGAPVAR